ncbi:hypothetical protein HanHA300_Chr04g0135431 [Helianthus annuus]|nr:hypothetical protein HanHA300_Chr04g0135431 [Helianthus annuus]KAJ0596901.1 hypothetical protein HanHA89_Chr04g0148321 [Helianthus annuus]KAJ0757583.1 hypothetical protein HanLR1_Chr04g0140441 [Helianthus annuus]KAJ0761266.1 hypothetical protein HanOQP8_Chr04g0147831 [Helianthus annuus]
MGLKDALRLKSFDSSELDIRATKTKEEDCPYLEQVNENLYKIRNPVAANIQGGSGSAPTEQAINISPLRTISVAAGVQVVLRVLMRRVRRLFYTVMCICQLKMKIRLVKVVMLVINHR